MLTTVLPHSILVLTLLLLFVVENNVLLRTPSSSIVSQNVLKCGISKKKKKNGHISKSNSSLLKYFNIACLTHTSDKNELDVLIAGIFTSFSRFQGKIKYSILPIVIRGARRVVN